MQIQIDSITIPPDRQRQDIKQNAIDDLAESLRIIGQIHPIIVDDDGTLVVGSCRLQAAKQLGWKTVRAERREDLSQWERDMIELEENIRRTPLTWKEELAAKAKFHGKHEEKYGKSAQTGGRGRKEGWKIGDSAQLLGISTGTMSQDLQLARSVENDEESYKDCRTKIQAWNIYQRNLQIKARQMIAIMSDKEEDNGKTTLRIDDDRESDKTSRRDTRVDRTDSRAYSGYAKTIDRPYERPKPTHRRITLHEGDARTIVPRLPNDSIHSLITDPPWGVEYDEHYGMKKEEGLKLLKEVLELLHPKLISGALCWSFCASSHLLKGEIYNLLIDTGYFVYERFKIWYKPKVGSAPSPYRQMKTDYEPIMLFSKDIGRNFNKVIYGVTVAKIQGHKLHPAQKPVELLKELIEATTVEHETVIDPFMGSGQTMVAARDLNRKGIGIEKDENIFKTAKGVLI